MKIHGYCDICGGPLLRKRQVDNLGNRLVTKSCWNGHYEELLIEDMERMEPAKNVELEIPVIGFFSVQ